MIRGRTAIAPARVLAIAGGIAAGAVLAFGGDDAREPTQAGYVEQVSAICETYGKQLDQIPPPSDPASPGAVFESISNALPILKEQAVRVRSLDTPKALRSQLDRFFDLTDRSILALERAQREAGKRELFRMVQAITAFEEVRDQAKRAAHTIGFDC